MGALWGLLTIVGPILLGLVLLYAVLSNRFKRNQAPKEVSEASARELREELNAADDERDA